METTNYKPAQFVKDWLPNVKKRLISHYAQGRSVASFMDENFHEALAAFAEAQRVECEEAYEFSNFGYVSEAILNAPMPEPKTE